MSLPVPSRPRSSLWSLARHAATALLVLAGAVGCTHTDRDPEMASPGAGLVPLAPLVAPTAPILLVQPPDRVLGPLRPVTESELQLLQKGYPFGIVTVESSVIDSDAVLRVQGPARTADGRAVEHRESTRRTQALGRTDDGLVRFRVGYPRDGSLWIEHGQRVGKTSPVEGKSYLIDVGPDGMRVLTDKGLTPTAEEVAIIQEDHARLGRRPRQDPDAPLRPGAPAREALALQTPSELVKANLAKALQRNGYVVDALDVRLQGVRDVDRTPCAMFTVSLSARRQKVDSKRSTWSEMRLGGEYAVRLADGWEAEVLLSGSTTATTQAMKEGVPVTISSAAFTRLHVRTGYDLPDPATVRTLEKLGR